MNRPVAAEADILTFADFFRIDAEVEDVLRHFGVDFETRVCELPRTTRPLSRIDELTDRLVEVMPHVGLTSEAARREFLIAPLMMEVVRYAGGKLRVEFPIHAGPQLQGNLDYFLQAQSRILVIEAKNEDMTRGFKQMAVELVALDRLLDRDADPGVIYGAVSTGTIWQFGFLDRAAQKLTQDLNAFAVPTRVEDVLRILIGCVSPE